MHTYSYVWRPLQLFEAPAARPKKSFEHDKPARPVFFRMTRVPGLLLVFCVVIGSATLSDDLTDILQPAVQQVAQKYSCSVSASVVVSDNVSASVVAGDVGRNMRRA